MKRRRRPSIAGASPIAAALAAVLALSACGGSADTAERSSPNTGSPAVTDAEPDFVRTTGDVDASDGAPPATAVGPESTGPALVVDATTSTISADPDPAPEIQVVPETGVPGIDSDDLFCRSWSQMAGSVQALGLASAVGDPDNAMRSEVIASPAVLSAWTAIGRELPVALESERDVLLDDFFGPFARRAGAAAEQLGSAGIRDSSALADAWLRQLADAGVDDPDLVVELPDVVDESTLDAAVDAFSAAVPAIIDDPSLITDASIPLTEAYLVANCPDGGVLAGNDVIS